MTTRAALDLVRGTPTLLETGMLIEETETPSQETPALSARCHHRPPRSSATRGGRFPCAPCFPWFSRFQPCSNSAHSSAPREIDWFQPIHPVSGRGHLIPDLTSHRRFLAIDHHLLAIPQFQLPRSAATRGGRFPCAPCLPWLDFILAFSAVKTQSVFTKIQVFPDQSKALAATPEASQPTTASLKLGA